MPFSTLSRRTALALVAGLSALAGAALAQPAPGTLLGSTGNAGNSLISIDTATGTGTFLCELGTLGPVTEIRHRADGVLFATTGQGSSNLITIDAGTCTETLVGQHQYGAVNALAFAGNTLYGAFFAPPVGPTGEGEVPVYLVTVDTSTANLTPIGLLPYDRVRGMAYDAATATMYGVGSTLVQPNAEGEPADELFTVDLGTAATTPIGSTGQSLGALEFGTDGTLYAGEAISVGPGEGDTGARLFTLDTATGAATEVGFTDFPAVSGLSFVPGGAPGPGPSVLEIPTLGPAGLAGLGLLLAGGAIALLRRRRD